MLRGLRRFKRIARWLTNQDSGTTRLSWTSAPILLGEAIGPHGKPPRITCNRRHAVIWSSSRASAWRKASASVIIGF
jgi:hypothetical protein